MDIQVCYVLDPPFFKSVIDILEKLIIYQTHHDHLMSSLKLHVHLLRKVNTTSLSLESGMVDF